MNNDMQTIKIYTSGQSASDGSTASNWKRCTFRWCIIKHYSALAASAAVIIYTILTSAATASPPNKMDGLFANLAKQQENAAKAGQELKALLMEFKSNCRSGKFIKGRVATKRDGTPEIRLTSSGDVEVQIVFDIVAETYNPYIEDFKKRLSAYAIHISKKNEALPRDIGDISGREITVEGTRFIFPLEMRKWIEEANREEYDSCALHAFLIGADGNVVAELPVSNAGLSLADEMKIYTSNMMADSKLNKYGKTVGDVAVKLCCGAKVRVEVLTPSGPFSLTTLQKVTGRSDCNLRWDSDRHNKSAHIPIQTTGRYWGRSQSRRSPSTIRVTFCKVPHDKLADIKDVRICCGGYQYRAFLKELATKGFLK